MSLRRNRMISLLPSTGGRSPGGRWLPVTLLLAACLLAGVGHAQEGAGGGPLPATQGAIPPESDLPSGAGGPMAGVPAATVQAPALQGDADERQPAAAAQAMPAAQAAPEVAGGSAAVQTEANHLWTLLAAILVFWMQAGFAFVEAGFTQAKNAANIMMKNLADMAFGVLAYWGIGFGLMFGTSLLGGWLGASEFFFDGFGAGGLDEGLMVFFVFQSVFAATAATIVSGCVAGRTNFTAYLLASIAITAVIYPVFGKWAWGSLFFGDPAGGFLEGWGFYDFAGSTVVHSIGGWCGLAGAIVVGPRLGKFGPDGKSRLIPGHNLVYGTIGTFILWMGWFGFNAGSTTSVAGSGFAHTAVTTMLAAIAGAATSMLVSKAKFGKYDLSLTCNGVLGGLVAITAGCFCMTNFGAVVTGAVAGAIVPFSILTIDRCRVDDPVGAITVHLVCGVWGTLAVGLFACSAVDESISGLFYGGGIGPLFHQLVGVLIAGGWAFPMAFGIFKIIDWTVGVRVSQQVEEQGLDVHEHGIGAYPAPISFESASR